MKCSPAARIGTDWVTVKAVTDEELDASIAADPDDVHEPVDWSRAVKGDAAPASATFTSGSTRTCSTAFGKPAAVIRPGSTMCCAPLWRAASAHRASGRPLPHRRHDVFGASADGEGWRWAGRKIRIDEDVLHWFRQAGRGDQTRISDVASAPVPGPIFSARTLGTSLPTQGFGYAVMNLGLRSGGSMIHTETMQGFRPSGASEQVTSNF